MNVHGALRKQTPYLFYGQTTSLCETCHGLVPTKIVIEGADVFYLKRCSRHGVQKTLVSTDAAYYKLCHDYIKPGDRPLVFQSRTEFGCPYDCGLCPDHEQHSCLAIIDVNEACNLACPVCFADSSPSRTLHRPLDEIGRMMDALVASEGEPDLLQLSGGEPTIHPHILDIIAMAKTRPIRHVMINTNGLRIAGEPGFARALAGFKPGFEVYLQFDSLNGDALKALRGADLTRVRLKALEHLEANDISTTLVVVVKRGTNEDEFGAIIDFALQWNCVRGITFQPIQDAGRNDGFDPARDRVVLSEIRSRIVAAGTPFTAGDIIPLPCNPESIAIGYALRKGRRVAPITSFFPRDMLVDALPNAITFEKYPELHRQVFEFFSLSTAQCNTPEKLNALLCCLPDVPVPGGLGYENIFRIAIVEFLDAYNFCIGRVKRSCIHFVTPAGQIVPFDTYNLFYRDGRIDDIRRRLRAAAHA
ncbi:MAG TPA: radical SAM protein [Aestuariivirgaceae bacterium]|nr:radical SAM protein [Aestuariivirgaceae bacterium]